MTFSGSALARGAARARRCWRCSRAGAQRRASTALARLAGTRVDFGAAQRSAGRASGSWACAIRLVGVHLLVLGAASPGVGARGDPARGRPDPTSMLVLDVSASMDARRRVAESHRRVAARGARRARPHRRQPRRRSSRSPATRCGCARSRSTARGAAATLESASTGTVSEPGSDLGKALSMAAARHAAGPSGGAGDRAVDRRRGPGGRRAHHHRRRRARRRTRARGRGGNAGR